MKVVQTDQLSSDGSASELLWIYNGLDCCVTREVFDVIEPQLDETTRRTYELELALQAPVLEMKIRGVKIDLHRRDGIIRELEESFRIFQDSLNRFIVEGLEQPPTFNWRSPAQLQKLFYKTLRLPEVQFQGRPTVNRAALEKLKSHFYARPFINHILALRDIGKRIGVLRTEIDPDGRIRTSYNIAGTSTGRFSSSLADFGTGTNLQNIEKRLRSIFIADPGMKFAQLDAEQGESRLVGAIEWNLFGDPRYLDACESGDLHTAVCRLAWGNQLKWTGDIGVDRGLAEAPFYREHSYRHMAKVLGHGTNYNGKPATMALHTKLDRGLIEQFQAAYFRAFPAHLQWHGRVAGSLLKDGFLTSLCGRRRWFFGRRDDDSTLREAIAFDPQSSLGDILNRGMLQVWETRRVQLLLQIHDAILVQYSEEQEDEIIPCLVTNISVPLNLSGGRQLVLPFEVKTGWNWGDFADNNPDGLKKYNGVTDNRKRAPETRWLDRKFR
jgi:DNA polymerase I